MKREVAVPIKQLWRRSAYGAASLSLLFGTATVTALAGGSIAGVPLASAQANQTEDVTIRDFAFSPATLTVERGTTVTWTNRDSAPHTVTADSGSGPASGQLQNGGTYSYTFNQVGSFPYHCQLHPEMRGVVVVTDDNGSGAADDNGPAVIASGPAGPGPSDSEPDGPDGGGAGAGPGTGPAVAGPVRSQPNSIVRAGSSNATQNINQTVNINVQTSQSQQIKSHSVTSSTSGGHVVVGSPSTPPPVTTTPPPTTNPPVVTAEVPDTTTPPPVGGRGGGDDVAQADIPATSPPTSSELPVGGSGAGEEQPVGGSGAGEPPVGGRGADFLAIGPVEAGQWANGAGISLPTVALGSALLIASGGMMIAHRRLTLGRR